MQRLYWIALLFALAPSCNAPPPIGLDAGGIDVGPGTDAAARSCFTDPDCDDGIYCNGTETCTTGHCTRAARACDDGVGCTRDLCNENTHACVSRAPDEDGDGFGDASCVDGSGVALGTDCDDTDPTVFPGNPEICNARDEDCDPTTLGGGDTDHDGAVPTSCCNPTPGGGMTCGRDCDDSNPSISQLATEICDTIDNDCDTLIDEHSEMMSWPDFDVDGYGDASATPDVVCVVPSSRANQGGDCNDHDAMIRPNGIEHCNAIDDDCDGTVDEDASAACGVTGATEECIAGVCVLTGCDALRFDCNGNASDGCEASLCDTSTECGVCGVSCGVGVRLCDSGQCVLTVDTIATINGFVRDASTGAPIAGATITSVDVCPAVTTTTAANGTYTLTVRTHAQPRWIVITQPGYPPHVQPAGGMADIFPSSIVDAWRADPDRNATPGATRAILVIEGGENPQAIHDGHLGAGNGATGSDLSPFTSFGDRVVYLGAVPGLMHLGGRHDTGGGCADICSPAVDVWLEAGAVTHVDAFSCGAIC